MRILAIDDNEAYLKLLSFFIEEIYPESKLYTAKTGEEGIEIIKKMIKENEDLDIILCDIRLPRLNGYEVAAELKKNKISIPLILITAQDTRNVEGYASALGLNFLSKSIGIPTILEKASDYLCRSDNQNY